jgi:hypothetical protein
MSAISGVMWDEAWAGHETARWRSASRPMANDTTLMLDPETTCAEVCGQEEYHCKSKQTIKEYKE